MNKPGRTRGQGAGRACPVATVDLRRRRQAGLSLITWLLVLLAAGLFIFAVFRVVPSYLECARVGSVLDGLRTDAATASIPALKTKLANQLLIDSLRDLTPNDFDFTGNVDTLTISFDQPIRSNFIGNLGFVVQCRSAVTVARSYD